MRYFRSPVIAILFIVWLAAITIMPVLGLNVTWIVVTGIVFPFSLALLKHEEGIFDFKQMSLPAAWFWTHVVFVVIPSLFVMYSETGNHPLRFILSVEISLLAVPAGILLGHAILKDRRGAVKAYYMKPVQGSGADFRSFMVLALVVACVVIGYYHTTQINSVPLLYMIQNPGAATKASLLREDAVKLLASNMSYVYDVLAKVMFPILVMVTGIRYFYVRTGWNRMIFGATFVVALLYCGMTLEKSPVGLAILCLVFAIYMKRGGKFKKEIWLIPIGLFGFPVVVFFYEFANSSLNTQNNLLNAVGTRLFYGGAQVLFYYFDVVPEALPYQNGATIGKLAVIMGVPQSKIANYVGLRIDPRLPKSVSANAPFLGTLYADWGMTGVVLGCLAAGLIIVVIQHYILSHPKTLRNMCIYGFVLLKITLLALSALPYVLGSGGVLIALIPMFLEDFVGFRRWKVFNKPRRMLRPVLNPVSDQT